MATRPSASTTRRWSHARLAGMTETSPAVVDTDLVGLRVPGVLRGDSSQILVLTTPFCAEYLDEEYAQECLTLVQGQGAGR